MSARDRHAIPIIKPLKPKRLKGKIYRPGYREATGERCCKNCKFAVRIGTNTPITCDIEPRRPVSAVKVCDWWTKKDLTQAPIT